MCELCLPAEDERLCENCASLKGKEGIGVQVTMSCVLLLLDYIQAGTRQVMNVPCYPSVTTLRLDTDKKNEC